MAGSARDIKRRIKGISSTMQITKAMELVSTAKLRKAREKLERTRPYYSTVLSNIQNVLSSSKDIRHPLLEIREVKKPLYIILAGDSGLAGGYNANIIRLSERNIKDIKDDVSIIAVGVKSLEYFKRRDYNVIGEFTNITEEPSFADARRITDLALDLYSRKEIDEINIVYSKFVSTLQQDAKILKLLPSSEVSNVVGDENEPHILTEFEPSPSVVLDYLIPKYIESAVYGALIEASSSEQAARRLAMEAATDNAGEMIDELNIEYNRARQAAITMEIAEIVTGAEALK